MTPPRVVKVEVIEVESLEGPRNATGVLDVYLSDGREFSLMAATPAWFEDKTRRLGLDFYYGHSILFLNSLKPDVAKKAAKELAKNDAMLCRYDTPRTTLPRVLEEFKRRH
ncbi:MAG: hypothetical protein HY748_12710 [Elusimicrobia bacterium]|nr:hypothetical protein [Elusimicrobiota bacterium]